MKLLIYGANGYTAQLICRMIKDYEITPVLAGRTASKVAAVAKEFGFKQLVFGLDDAKEVERHLNDFDVVLHCAGPFKFTAQPMIEACIKAKTHYLDITGEIEVFELAHTYDKKAKKAGVMIMPGVGFDVVPTDCMAVFLKNQMPDATHLQLAFASVNGGVSHGTAMTMTEGLGKPGAERKDGEIIEVPVGQKSMKVPFFEKELFCMTIPWGDVSTAYYSTGIPNIETYTSIPLKTYKYIKLQRYFNWFLKSNMVKAMAQNKIKNRSAGPSDEVRKKAISLVWGKVKNDKGETVAAKLKGPEGYTLTATTALIIAKRVLNGEAPAGFQTPAKAYGADLIMEVSGVKRAIIKEEMVA